MERQVSEKNFLEKCKGGFHAAFDELKFMIAERERNKQIRLKVDVAFFEWSKGKSSLISRQGAQRKVCFFIIKPFEGMQHALGEEEIEKCFSGKVRQSRY